MMKIQSCLSLIMLRSVRLELSICQRPGTTCLALTRPVCWHPTTSEIAAGASTGQLFVRILGDKGIGLHTGTQEEVNVLFCGQLIQASFDFSIDSHSGKLHVRLRPSDQHRSTTSALLPFNTLQPMMHSEFVPQRTIGKLSCRVSVELQRISVLKLRPSLRQDVLKSDKLSKVPPVSYRASFFLSNQ